MHTIDHYEIRAIYTSRGSAVLADRGATFGIAEGLKHYRYWADELRDDARVRNVYLVAVLTDGAGEVLIDKDHA